MRFNRKTKKGETGYLRDAYPRKAVSRRKMLSKTAFEVQFFYINPDHTVVLHMQRNWKNYPRSLSLAILRSLDENEFSPAWYFRAETWITNSEESFVSIDTSISFSWIRKIGQRRSALFQSLVRVIKSFMRDTSRRCLQTDLRICPDAYLPTDNAHVQRTRAPDYTASPPV